MVLLAIMPGVLFAQQSVLEEGFESTSAGSLPSGWTQEPGGAAKTWAVEVDEGNNLFDPAACATGKGRIKLVSGSGSSHEEVLLISPVIDITTLAEPILVFDYAAIRHSTGDVDSLKVYYRLRDDRPWVLARAYGEADNWVHDTIDFTSKTASFQIAFGGVDNGARGVALDNIKVTSRPQAQSVSGVELYNLIHNEGKMRWTGPATASYNIKIATQELANPSTATEADGVYITGRVEYETTFRMNASDNKALTSSTEYWYYIQTDMGYGDVSPWVSGQFTSACEPVQSFATGFDTEEDIACWVTIGEASGTCIATAPTVARSAEVQSGTSDTSGPIMMQTRPASPHSGASALWMPVWARGSEGYSRVYAVSPRLADDVNLKEMQLSFWVYTTSKQIHLKVIVSDWPDDFSNAEDAGEISVRTTQQFEQITLTFEDITTSGKYVVFMIDGSEEYIGSPQFPYVMIDELVLEAKGACTSETKVVMFSTPKVSGSTAELNWNRSGAVKYDVKVGTSAFNPATDAGTVFDGQIDTLGLALKDLKPAMRYYYYVRPICASGVVGTWSNSQTFDTDCLEEGVDIPLRENFDAIECAEYGQAGLPVCWSEKSTAGNSIYITRSNYANSLYNYVTTYTSGVSYMITPKIKPDLKEVQLRFAYSIDQSNIPLEVGVIEDPNDDATYTKVAEFIPASTGSWNNYAWENATVIFDSYTGTGKYIAFKFPTSGVSYRIDDVVVEDKSACAEPTEFRSTGATTTTITFDWTPSENNETEWAMAYGKKGAVLGMNTEEVTGITKHPYTLEDLDENTEYDVYLRSVCGPDALGQWLGPISAKTISPAQPDYSCDFEGSEAGAWTLKNGAQTNAWIVGDAVKDETNTVTSSAAGKALYISDDYGTSNMATPQTTFAYATRLFELEAGLLDFEFDWRLNDYGKSYILPFLVPADIAIEGGQYTDGIYKVNPESPHGEPYYNYDWEDESRYDWGGWIYLTDQEILVAEDADWHHYKYTYQLRESGRYNLVLLYKYDSYMGTSGQSAAVDNVKVTANTTTCLTPEDIRVFDITQTSAKIEFLNYNADQWKVVVTTSTMETHEEMEGATVCDTVLFASTMNSNPLQITGLTSDTYYNVYFRPTCSGSDENWASTGFTTICESAEVPLYYDFDAENSDGQTYEENGFMLCWRRIPSDVSENSWGMLTSSNGAYTVIGKFPSYDTELLATNMTNMLMFKTSFPDGTPYAASPEMKPDVKALQLSFRAMSEYDYANYPYEIEVGVMTDPLDTATFELVETVAPRYANQWKTYNVYFDGYAGTGKYIAMRVSPMQYHSGTMYVDDLKIDSISGCVPPREITVENITSNSADISWRVVGETGNYHVKVSTEPIGSWQESTNVYDEVVMGDNKLHIDGLRSSKMYYVYVRTVCEDEADGDYSEGISEATFRTECGTEEVLPYYEDFESYELNEVPSCWTIVEEPAYGGVRTQSLHLSQAGVDVVGKSIGKFSLTLNSDNYFRTIVALPAMGAEKVSELSLTFQGMASTNNMIVGVISDLNDPESFTVVDTCTVPVNYTWCDFRVDFADYKGDGKYIAFYLEKSFFGNSFYLENVMVRKSSVLCADATAPQVLNVTSTSATVRWADNPSVSAFELKVSTDDINPEIEDGDVLNGEQYTTLSATLENLNPSQEYYVYIRNVCDGNSAGYWSDATTFLTQCENPEPIPYNEDFMSYQDIQDMGFFPDCWRNRVITYGSISPADQTDPYVENAVTRSMFMKAVYAEDDNSYAVVDVATPAIDFGEAGVGGHYLEMNVKSSAAEGPIYVGMMSDPSDATTFVAYDTIMVNTANEWEKHVVNFLYHEGDEKHIAFRINSLDAGTTYQVNITDIKVDVLPDCMPPFRVRADVRPNKAFITWMPGDKVNTTWKYYISTSKMPQIPFTDEEWEMNNAYSEMNIVKETSETSVTVNGLEDWTDYYMYIRTAGEDCEEFYSLPIQMLQSRGTCGNYTWEDLPYTTDFSNDGFGAEDPTYSAYPDCWAREDGFVGDSVSYPYITEDSALYFKSVLDTVCYAYLPRVSTYADTVITKSQVRFTAKGLTEGAQAVVGVSASYSEGWPAVYYYVFAPVDTIDLTEEWTEYVVEFEGFEWDENDTKYYSRYHVTLGVNEGGEYKISDLAWEEIPYCYTPEMTLKEYDLTSFRVDWTKLDDQDRWEVAYGETGFDLAEADLIPRTDTTYTVVNLREGTPYEFYMRSQCGNGLSSDWAHMYVTTKQTPAAYPYESGDLSDGTVISADTICYAYRTVDMPAGPHKLAFDWKLADDAAAWLRVFLVPEDVMITADADFGLTETTQPENWTEIKTLKGETAWLPSEYDMYVSKATSGAVNIVFVWFKSGADVKEVVRNVKTLSSTECTVPEELTASQITATSAVLSWESYNADAWDMNWWETSNPGGSQTVLDVTPGYVLSGLQPDTEYTFEVSSQCKPGEYSEEFTFRTACAPVDELFETFDEGIIDNCWKQYYGLFDEVTADPNALKPVEDVWTITDTEVVGSTGTPHVKLTVAGSDCANWLVSPAINLTENSALSFDLALTAYGTNGPIASEIGQTDDRFIVVISDDEGRTWKSANATIWDNAKGLNKIYNRIGNKASRIEVDLSAYTGKTIRVGFYGESTVALESNDIHIDSVRIDCRVNYELSADVCQGYSYYANGFSIPREETEVPGEFTYTRVGHAASGCDSTVILHLTVNQGFTYEYDIKICSNELPYTDENFPDGLTETGTHTKTYPAANGCDSVVILNLVVNEAYSYDRSLEIYDYELPYEYECRTFDVGTTSGTYEVNCPTAEGCDSIVNLTLTVHITDGLGNVVDGSKLFLVPNPVEMGATVIVDRAFTEAESKDVRIEVFNNAGMRVETFNREGDNIEFDAPNVAGVYVIRITTADGKTLIGRLIVE